MPATVIGPGTLHIGGDDVLVNFSAQCRGARVVPSVDRGDNIDLLDGSTMRGDRSESWQLTGTFQQDYGKGERGQNVVEWLFDHRGEEHPFRYVPNNTDGRETSGVLTVEAIEWGGNPKEKPTSDFSFDLIGAPVIGDDPDL